MTAIEMMYGRWGNYIPQDIRKQFEKDCLKAEQEIEKLKENKGKIIHKFLKWYRYNNIGMKGNPNRFVVKQYLILNKD